MIVTATDCYGQAVTLGDTLAGDGAMRAVVDGISPGGLCVIRHTGGLGGRGGRGGRIKPTSTINLARSRWRLDRGRRRGRVPDHVRTEQQQQQPQGGS